MIAALKKVIMAMTATNIKDKSGSRILSHAILKQVPNNKIRKNKNNGMPPTHCKNFQNRNIKFFEVECKISVLLILVAMAFAIEYVAISDELITSNLKVSSIIFCISGKFLTYD